MSYFDRHQKFDTSVATALPVARFDAAELRVISLAGSERLSSLSQPGRLARILRRLFGGSHTQGLANPRLEALRRLSILAWHHSYALPVTAVSAFLNAGFSEAQFEYALAIVARLRDQARLMASGIGRGGAAAC